MMITPIPDIVWIEEAEHNQQINFDFLIKHTKQMKAKLIVLSLKVFDAAGKRVYSNQLDRNAVRPNINILSKHSFEPGERHILFNPFHTFRPDISIYRMTYEFLFEKEDKTRESMVVEVYPHKLEVKPDLILPMTGKLLVMDGHDYLAHHRRIDLNHPVFEIMGIQANSNRFAVDFVSLDAKGRMYRLNGVSEKDWFGFGASVYAPAEGEVVFVRSDQRDQAAENPAFDFLDPAVQEDPGLSQGNNIKIFHREGYYSSLSHLLFDSIIVRQGEKVKKGQYLGKLGFSGSVGGYVHLHYEAVNTLDLRISEGIPLYFNEFQFLNTISPKKEEAKPLNTGDAVESLFPHYQ